MREKSRNDKIPSRLCIETAASFGDGGVSVFRIFRMSDETAKSMDAQDVAQMYKPTDLQIYRHTDDIEERI